MEQRRLGRSGLTVPVIGMGSWKTFDVEGNEAEANAQRVVDAAIGAGTRFFDSSPMYGRSEKLLGRCLEKHREKVIVATKVWTENDDEAEQQIANALEWYGGKIDLYQIHNLVSWQKRLDRLERLKEEGKIAAIGITHYQHSAFPEMIKVMRTGRIDTIQVPYNPWQREVEKEVLPFAEELGLGVVVMRPFGEGKLLREQPDKKELEPLKQFGITNWTQALLKWILSDRRCHVPIPATSKADHAIANAVAGEAPWPGEEQRELIARLATR